jgi:hypothetical protein
MHQGKQTVEDVNRLLNIGHTMVSPIPKLRIPAKGASGLSLNPDDIHLGSA